MGSVMLSSFQFPLAKEGEDEYEKYGFIVDDINEDGQDEEEEDRVDSYVYILISTCVRRPKYIMCTGGDPSGYIPTHTTRNTSSR
uniref:Uncharacterized protein n=1 Tax=Lactuca sativa TaxID=4236 RepID=A0A9R1XGT3_LACSA|nr:hypothetical protein LSAT_V11C400174530 [Lactuca sativa]